MSKIKQLKNIEVLSLSLLEETNEILLKNYPLDSREYLEGKEKSIVERNDNLIDVLDDTYKTLYNILSEEEKGIYEYKNLKIFYNNSTSCPKGLVSISSKSNISEIEDALNRAKSIGIEAIEQLNYGEEIYDMNIVKKNIVILKAVKKVLELHMLGDAYISSLERYKNRVDSKRTTEDDMLDYIMLVKRAKELSYQYAQAIVTGITEEQKNIFEEKYKQIFEQETKIIEFMPVNVLKEVFENLTWYKTETEKDPNRIIRDYDEEKQKDKTKVFK